MNVILINLTGQWNTQINGKCFMSSLSKKRLSDIENKDKVKFIIHWVILRRKKFDRKCTDLFSLQSWQGYGLKWDIRVCIIMFLMCFIWLY